MSASTSKQRLGRGLAALIGDDLSEDGAVEQARSLRMVPVEALKPSANNPRRQIAESDLDDLASSIREKGVLQPIVVRPDPSAAGSFEIVAGERRWRAAQRSGVHEVPIVVRDLTDAEALEIAIVENVQRTDLNALDEAEGYQQLLDRFGYTQAQLAETIGKSRSHIANTLRLTGLPEKTRSLLRDGRLSAGHARALIGCDDADAIAAHVVKAGLSVRQTEDHVRKLGETSGSGARKSRKAAREKDSDTLALERDLAQILGLSVEITDLGRRGGQVTIGYRTLEQLDDICRRLSAPPAPQQ